MRRRIDGRWVVRSFDTLAEAVAYRDSLEDHRRRGLTVAGLCRAWFAGAQSSYSPGGRRNYETAVRLHIAPSAIGRMEADALTVHDLRAFYRTLRFTPAKKAHQVIRHAYRWGLENEPRLRRRDNPALQTAPVRRECLGYDAVRDYEADEIRPVDEKDIPTRTEIEKLLVDAESHDRRWWLYLVLAVATGARPGELCALQRKHFDLQRGLVIIEWSADRVSGMIKRPKTRWSVRTLPLPDALLQAIAPALPEEPEAFLFPPHRRSPMPCWNGRGVYRRLASAVRRTGLPHYTPHALRHYNATRLLAEGESPAQVARRLGHKDDTLVRKLYGRHIDDDAQRRLADRSIGHLLPERLGGPL